MYAIFSNYCITVPNPDGLVYGTVQETREDAERLREDRALDADVAFPNERVKQISADHPAVIECLAQRVRVPDGW